MLLDGCAVLAVTVKGTGPHGCFLDRRWIEACWPVLGKHACMCLTSLCRWVGMTLQNHDTSRCAQGSPPLPRIQFSSTLNQQNQPQALVPSLTEPCPLRHPPLRSQHCFILPHQPWWKVWKYNLPGVWKSSENLITKLGAMRSPGPLPQPVIIQAEVHVYRKGQGSGPDLA